MLRIMTVYQRNQIMYSQRVRQNELLSFAFLILIGFAPRLKFRRSRANLFFTIKLDEYYRRHC